MVARCRNVEDPVTNVLNNRFVQITDNHNFWIYKDVYETKRQMIYNPTYSIKHGRLTMSEGIDKRKQIISVRYTDLNFVLLLVDSTCVLFTQD